MDGILIRKLGKDTSVEQRPSPRSSDHLAPVPDPAPMKGDVQDDQGCQNKAGTVVETEPVLAGQAKKELLSHGRPPVTKPVSSAGQDPPEGQPRSRRHQKSKKGDDIDQQVKDCPIHLRPILK